MNTGQIPDRIHARISNVRYLDLGYKRLTGLQFRFLLSLAQIFVTWVLQNQHVLQLGLQAEKKLQTSQALRSRTCVPVVKHDKENCARGGQSENACKGVKIGQEALFVKKEWGGSKRLPSLPAYKVRTTPRKKFSQILML